MLWLQSGLDWRQFAASGMIRGAEWALYVPFVRDYLLDRLIQRLGQSYDDCTAAKDPDKLMHVRWLGARLGPFLHRLIDERPAAARAILRFLHTWTADMYRRKSLAEGGEVNPCTVVIDPTDRCNLSCPGCYAQSTRDGSDLTYDQLVQIVRQVVDMGVTLITISGGEPFLRERQDQTLTRLARRFSDRGFLVYTNGTMIDEPIAERLGRAGNVFPAISVEGFEHQTDRRRGKGIYEQNRTARQRLARHGVMAGFSATVTRENCESICSDEFIDLRIREGDLFGWFFLMHPIGRAPRPDLMVTAEQRLMLRQTVHRWRQQQRPIFLGDFWNDGHLSGGCIAGGRDYFHIYANGDISPCVFTPVAAGNVFDIIHGRSPYRSLNEFVQTNPVFRAFRREQATITDRDRPCLLIDHPEAFRRVARCADCRPARNMPPGYLDGQIARTFDALAAEWRRVKMPPLPAQVGRMQYYKDRPQHDHAAAAGG
jgi:MoaA/NifB/PqqE/SkfB family radical SAM enzyme